MDESKIADSFFFIKERSSFLAVVNAVCVAMVSNVPHPWSNIQGRIQLVQLLAK